MMEWVAVSERPGVVGLWLPLQIMTWCNGVGAPVIREDWAGGGFGVVCVDALITQRGGFTPTPLCTRHTGVAAAGGSVSLMIQCNSPNLAHSASRRSGTPRLVNLRIPSSSPGRAAPGAEICTSMRGCVSHWVRPALCQSPQCGHWEDNPVGLVPPLAAPGSPISG